MAVLGTKLQRVGLAALSWLPSPWWLRRRQEMTVVADEGSAAKAWTLEVLRTTARSDGSTKLLRDPRMTLYDDDDFKNAIAEVDEWCLAREGTHRRWLRWPKVVRWCLYDPSGRPASGPVNGASIGAALAVLTVRVSGIWGCRYRPLDPAVVVSAGLRPDGGLVAVTGIAHKVAALEQLQRRLIVAPGNLQEALHARQGERTQVDSTSKAGAVIRLCLLRRSWAMIGSLVVVLCLTAVTAYSLLQVKSHQRAQARAETAALVQNSVKNMDRDISLAALSAAAAADRAPASNSAVQNLIRVANFDPRLKASLIATGLTEPFTAVAMEPSGSRAAVGDEHGHVGVVDLARHTWVSGETGKATTVVAAAFNRSSQRLVTMDRHGNLDEWQITAQALTRKDLRHFQYGGGSDPTVLALDPSGTRLAVANDENIIVYDLSGRKPELVLDVDGVRALAFAADRLFVGLISDTGTDALTVYELDGSNPRRTKPPLPPSGTSGFGFQGILALAASDDGKILVSGTTGGYVATWDTRTLRRIREFSVDGPVLTLNVNAGGSAVVVAVGPDAPIVARSEPNRSSAKAKVAVWNLADATQASSTLAGDFQSAVVAADAKLNNALILSLGGAVSSWSNISAVAARSEFVTGLAASDTDHDVLVLYLDGELDRLDVVTGSRTKLLDVAGMHGQAYCMALGPDGQLLAVGHGDGTVTVWNLQSRSKVAELSGGHTKPVNAVAFDRSGRLLASAGQDGRAVVWDAHTGTRQTTFSLGRSIAFGLAFSTDDRLLVGDQPLRSGVDEARLWWGNLRTGRIDGSRILPYPVMRLLPLADGGTLIGYANGLIEKSSDVTDAASARPVARLGSNIGAMMVNHRDGLLVASTIAGEIGLFDLGNGEPVVTTKSLDPPSADETGTSAIYALTITRDGSRAVLGSASGQLTVVRLDRRSARERVCELAAGARPDDVVLDSASIHLDPEVTCR